MTFRSRSSRRKRRLAPFSCASGPRWFASPPDEQVDLVDESDRVVGTAALRECLERGLLHRAVCVIVRRSDGSVLLQRRSKKDLWHPGLWTLSSTGHVRKGEAREAAAGRELWEELGLRGNLSFHSSVLLAPIRSHGLTEREWVSVYTTETDDAPKIDPGEVDSVRALTVPQLNKMESSSRMTPDARIILRLYLDSKLFPKNPT